MQTIREENQRLRADNTDLRTRIPTYFKYHPNDNSNNTTTIDYNSPGGLRKFEAEDHLGSPITQIGPNDLTTLKIEDLEEGAKKGYNPIWKL